jgi:hypothetical protein
MHWQGRDYDFDIDMAGTAELRAIKRHPDFGFTLRKLMEGVGDLDVDAATCLYWLVMRSDGQHDLVLSTQIEFPVVEFLNAWVESQPEPEPDPTRDGSLPGTATPAPPGSSTAISARSATSTSSRSRGSATSAAKT